MCTKSAKVGRLASTLLYSRRFCATKTSPHPTPHPTHPRSSLRGPAGRTKVAKVRPLRATVKSAKVRPTPYVGITEARGPGGGGGGGGGGSGTA